ncbi:MAG: beta-ketoacyl-[acyl-carrier-protein] synthase family protein [Dysgonamonadaceae bacterium]|nr:beta-ketoacyl-[acyl-carrier-protein] synthase family protein [Dysgonamonadaceae bacterium]
MMKRKTLVTGLGCYTSIGKNIANFSDNLFNERHGFKRISKINTDSLRNNFAASIEELDDVATITGQNVNIMAMHASLQAIHDARLTDFNPIRVGISIGTSVGGYSGYIDDIIYNYDENNKTPLNPLNKLTHKDACLNISPALIAYDIAKYFGFYGGIAASITACSAGANAIAFAKDLIVADLCDVVLVVGVDPISEISLYGFNALMALTKTDLKVMDNNRSGLLIGEGAAALVIESDEYAKKRNAKIYCELKGTGICNEAYHATQPRPDGLGAYHTMLLSLSDANIYKDDIDYVNLHGTGTKYNDIMELNALTKLFGADRLKTLPISSSKSMIGHTLGAAGVIEALISILALKNSIIPANINFNEMIDGFQYNIIKKTIYDNKMNYIMSNSFGFAGNCASLIFGKYE